MGIGNGFSRGGQVDFVLGALSEEEIAEMPAIAARVIQGVKDFSTIGPARAMNFLNSKPKTEEKKPENPPEETGK